MCFDDEIAYVDAQNEVFCEINLGAAADVKSRLVLAEAVKNAAPVVTKRSDWMKFFMPGIGSMTVGI